MKKPPVLRPGAFCCTVFYMAALAFGAFFAALCFMTFLPAGLAFCFPATGACVIVLASGAGCAAGAALCAKEAEAKPTAAISATTIFETCILNLLRGLFSIVGADSDLQRLSPYNAAACSTDVSGGVISCTGL